MVPPVKSLYTPGRVAKNIVGREKQLRNINRDLGFMLVSPELLGRTEVYVGPRGVGKTSFLREVQSQAEKNNFSTLWVTAGDGPFLQSLIAAVEELSVGWKQEARHLLRQVIESLTISIAGIEISGKEIGSSQQREIGLGRQLQSVLVTAGKQAVAEGKAGVIVLIDEVQEADAEGLRALAYAWQHMQSEAAELPMAVYCTGLSHTQDVITDAVSFGERFKYAHLTNLDSAAATKAFVDPAQGLGGDWEGPALRVALGRTEGYPYFIQLLADLSWQAAQYPASGSCITSSNLTEALHAFEDSLEDFFRARWVKATEREAALLKAMASLGDGPYRRSDIAESMGTSSSGISMARRSLMDKGIIEASQHGLLGFTVPGFAQFVRSESEI